MNCRKTQIYAPNYYNAFKCTADKCRHSCCIGWEICIDGRTMEKYKKHGDILNTVTCGDDGPCFIMKDDGRCPHLNGKGLCDIYIAHGEELWSDICRNHPRFYNRVGENRIEIGLGTVCEEVCRLMLENDTPFSLIEADEPYKEALSDIAAEEFPCGFDPLPQRDRIISIAETFSESFDQTVKALKTEFNIPEMYTMDEWLDRFLELEILGSDWEKALNNAKGRSPKENSGNFGKYYRRLLTYFVFRHVSVAESFDNLRARLAFAILSAQMIKLLFEAKETLDLNSLIDTARRYSEEIEYCEDNTSELIFEFESVI